MGVSRAVFTRCIFLIMVLHRVAANGSSSSFRVPLNRRTIDGVFAPVEDGQGILAGYTQYLTMVLVASPTFDDGSGKTSVYNSAEVVVDTGSGLLDMFLKNTVVPENCQALYRKYPNSTLDPRLLTPLSANSPACAALEYHVPKDDSDTCMFRISYGGGTTVLTGFAAQEAFAFENSTQVLGSSGGAMALAESVGAALGGMMTIAAVENATNCEAFPGLAGMDNNQNSVVSQLVSQNVIGVHALSVCMDVRDKASFAVFGPGMPKDAILHDVIMYNGTTIQSIQTENDEFETSIRPLMESGLSSHYYVIVNGLQIGDSGVIEGPISAILDTGFPGLGLTKSMLEQVHAQTAANAGDSSTQSGCFIVGADESVPDAVSRVVPNITISFTNETRVVIPGWAYTQVLAIENSGWEVCSTLSESSPQQIALGTAFFLNRFVQMDSVLGVARMGEFDVCPSGVNEWIVPESVSVKGGYTFPYSVASDAAHTCGFVAIILLVVLHAF